MNLKRWMPLLAAGAVGCGQATQEIDTKDYSQVDMEYHDSTLLGGLSEGSSEATAVLKVANTASRADLLAVAGLRERAAYNIDAYRWGDNEAVGGGDDKTYAKLSELDALPFVGDNEFKQLLTFAKALGYLGSSGSTSTLSASNTTSLSLPDKSTNSSTLTVADNVTVDSLKLTFDISHTYPGDLVITLSKDGKSVVASSRKNFARPTVFDASSAFKGISAKGTWTLTIEDQASGDSGTLNNWKLDIGHAGGSTNVGTWPLVGSSFNVNSTDVRRLGNTSFSDNSFYWSKDVLYGPILMNQKEAYGHLVLDGYRSGAGQYTVQLAADQAIRAFAVYGGKIIATDTDGAEDKRARLVVSVSQNQDIDIIFRAATAGSAPSVKIGFFKGDVASIIDGDFPGTRCIGTVTPQDYARITQNRPTNTIPYSLSQYPESRARHYELGEVKQVAYERTCSTLTGCSSWTVASTGPAPFGAFPSGSKAFFYADGNSSLLRFTNMASDCASDARIPAYREYDNYTASESSADIKTAVCSSSTPTYEGAYEINGSCARTSRMDIDNLSDLGGNQRSFKERAVVLTTGF